LRAHTWGCGIARLAKTVAGLLSIAAVTATPAAAATYGSGGAPLPPPPPPANPGGTPIGVVPPAPIPGAVAKLASDGRTAIPPASAPPAVKQAIYTANKITTRPYRYGGGHKSFESRAYDCSGSVSYLLHGAGILASPLDSRAFMRWGLRGKGQWITVFTNPGHAYAVVAGLRFDTSGPGESGPRWRIGARSSSGYRARHVDGL
jgi:cell wall-associated NlpC family hydrolase